MSFIDKIGPRPALIITLSIIVLSCSSPGPVKREYVAPNKLTQKTVAPGSVLIMPFINETDQPGIEELTRKSFYNHFSSRSYRDFELIDIDRGLEALKKDSTLSWRDLPPARIGEFFDADYLVYGKVKEFKKLFLGIYSQIAITIQMEILDASNGYLVWVKTVSKRSHEGGLPFSLFGIIPAALRSGLHMQEEKTTELADRISRDLVGQIPELPGPDPSPYHVEIQVASFLEKGLAQEASEGLAGKGFDARIEMVTLDNLIWHRVLLGPYDNLTEAEKVRGSILEQTRFQPILIHNRREKHVLDPGRNE